MDLSTVRKNLEANGFTVSVFETAAQAAEYLDKNIDGATVGMGGSVTLDEMKIYEKLSAHNTVYWHWRTAPDTDRKALFAHAQTADVYLSSVNGIAGTGEIINIDGTGNRVSAIQFGHKKVFLVAGCNKLAPDYESALYRARNTAAPLNAKRLGCATPCAAKGDRCYDCDSPARICRGLSVLWKKPGGCDYEIVLINEPLGY